MSVFREFGLPMQPGEPSWASLKCDGGPHMTDFDEPTGVTIEANAEARSKTAPPNFDMDAVALAAIKARGTREDRQAYGLPA